LDPPDICLFYANPAQMILFINGLQWKSYRRYDFSITGESACADSLGPGAAGPDGVPFHPLLRGAALRGRGGRRVADGLPARGPRAGVEGLQGLSKAGLRYPIMPYGPQADPGEGMARSYSDKS
jgi:hypothetical protein